MSKVKKAPAKKATKASSKTSAKAKAKTTKKAAKKSSAKKSSKAKQEKPATEELELLNETGRRVEAIKPVVERRKRRRQIDPTTCEREYSDPEIEFMQAMDDYKRQSGRMFPTCSEILEVIARMGYRKIEASAELMYDPNESTEEEASNEESLENDDNDDEFEEEDDC